MNDDRHLQTGRISALGIVLNILLSAGKLVVGFFTGSRSMVADGFNNVGDVFSSVMTMIGNHLAGKPSDEDHPYGHGKAEYVFSLIISIFMLLVAYEVLTGAINSLVSGSNFEFSLWLVVVSITSVAVKWVISHISGKIGQSQNNLMLIAMSEDSRNDIMTSLSVVIGSIFARYGIFWVDSVIGIFISLWIAYSGLRVFAGAYNVLMDTNMSISFKNELEQAIRNVPGVDHIDSITAKPVGISYIIIVKVSVDGGISVIDGHTIAGIIKEKVASIQRVADVVVHINPA